MLTLLVAGLPIFGATVQRRGDTTLFETQFWLVDPPRDPMPHEMAEAGTPPDSKPPDRRQYATLLLPASSPALGTLQPAAERAKLAQQLVRHHPLRESGKTGGLLASESIPEERAELMLTIGLLLVMGSVSLSWLVRDRRPYTRSDARLGRGESLCMPTLVFSTHAGLSSLSTLAGSIDRATPRRGPGRAAPDVRSRAAAAGGR